MRFGEHRHAERVGQSRELAHPRRRERGHDEQNAVGAQGARFVHLVRIDHEILAQYRQSGGGARCPEMLGPALKKPRVGEHRQAGGAVPRVGAGDRLRIERLAQDAFARACLLDLGDHRRLTGRDLRAQGADEVARFLRRLRLAPQRGFAASPLRLRDFLGLDGENSIQNVNHHARAAG